MLRVWQPGSTPDYTYLSISDKEKLTKLNIINNVTRTHGFLLLLLSAVLETVRLESDAPSVGSSTINNNIIKIASIFLQ